MEPLVPCIQYLGVLWELTLLGEPLLVIANTPQLCSQVNKNARGNETVRGILIRISGCTGTDVIDSTISLL